jgi:hypothetical protein
MSTRPDIQTIGLRVRFSTVEDARAALFSCLEGVLPDVKRSRLADRMAANLRDAGLLGQSVEQHYSAQDVARLCGYRSSAWAVKHAKLGHFGPVACDGGDWLIPASGVNRYLAEHQVPIALEKEAA